MKYPVVLNMGHKNTDLKLLLLGGLMAGTAAMLQIAPVILTELFLPVTLLGALPIYLISRIKPRYGIASFIAAALLVFMASPHECLFFISTNGIVGISLGTSRYYIEKKGAASAAAALPFASALCLVNYVIGIPVFGTTLPGPLSLQIIMLAVFCGIYCRLYLGFSDYIYEKLKSSSFF